MSDLVDDSTFDVAVIGAGPAGAATARRLAQKGCSVLLVERSTFETPRVGETLMPAVQPLLSELGVWDGFLALRPLPSWGTRSFWGGPDPREHSHLMSPFGCGWHVDRQCFDQMLADAAVRAGAILRTETRLIDCEGQGPGNWRLTLESGTRLSCVKAHVVVDATGRSAWLARRLGARRIVLDKLVGVATQFASVPDDKQRYTLVETVAEGWWYSAPVGADRMIAILMTDSDICGRTSLISIDNWWARLRSTNASVARIGDAPKVWGPRAFNSASHRLRRNETASYWLAVGDAALAVDPASGRGVARALRAAHAAAVTTLALLQGAPSEAIRNYEADCDDEWALYLQEYAAYYRYEPRWQEARFWGRRRSLPRHLP